MSVRKVFDPKFCFNPVSKSHPPASLTRYYPINMLKWVKL
jgi:hypothetical protein